MIETERLLLRPVQVGDLDRWAEMMADEEACRYVGGVQPKAMVWRSLMTMAGAWALTGVAMFSVVEKSTARWVGRVGPWQPFGWPGTEVGWSLHPDAWGKGYALESARAMMDYAFTTLGWTTVIHCIDPKNTPSQRVAERLGSRKLGPGRLPAPYANDPVDLWGQTREEWMSRSAQGETKGATTP
jgi:RimJ/RimL family protein N-acetyltransferase